MLKNTVLGVILGMLKMAIFDLQTSVRGDVNRSEINQDSSLVDQIGLRSL